MRSILSVSVLVAGVGFAFVATPIQAASNYSSQSDYLQHIAECVRLFFADHAQYEASCTPGPQATPSNVVTSGGGTPPREDDDDDGGDAVG